MVYFELGNVGWKITSQNYCKILHLQSRLPDTWKQSPRSVLWNWCSYKFYKINRKTPVPESLIKKETLAQVLSCKVCEFSQNTFFTEHLWVTDSGHMFGLRESWNMICLRESNLSYRNRDFVRDHLQELYHKLRDIACQSLTVTL